MDVTPAIARDKKLITGYGSGSFKINGEWLEGSLLVFPDRIIPWPAKNAAEISIETLGALISSHSGEGALELLLIGTGNHMTIIDPAFRSFLKSRNIAVDSMDTGAACRTYNVLLGEERRVAAALIAI